MPPHSALIDFSSRRLLALSPHVASITFLSESIPDSRHVPNVHSPHYREAFPFPKDDTSRYPEWIWNIKNRVFEHADTAPSVEIVAYSVLAIAKQAVISRMMRMLSVARYAMKTGVEFQETVYLLKRAEAERFRAAGYPQQSLSEYRFINQYAALEQISPRAATDEILLQAQLDEDVLAKTEDMRLRFFRAVRHAKLEELESIEESFLREYYGNTRA